MSTERFLKLLIGIAGIGVLIALLAPAHRTPPPMLARAAPDFSFTVNGTPATLESLHGKVVVLNFWASWCDPCVAEMPSLEQLHQGLKDRGLYILAVSVDESQRAFETFIRQKKLTFVSYRDPEKKISSRYGTFQYPETYIIDKDGILQKKVIGAIDWTDPQVIAYLDGLLKK